MVALPLLFTGSPYAMGVQAYLLIGVFHGTVGTASAANYAQQQEGGLVKLPSRDV
jgi:hypothetical protein